MAFPKEHAARIRNPSEFKSFERMNDFFNQPGIHVINGKDEKGNNTIQSIRFSAASFTTKQAKKWLKDKRYHQSMFESANESVKMSTITLDRTNGEAFVAGGEIFIEKGITKQLFLKDMISTGTYVHPEEGWTLQVDRSRMDKWAKQFAAMKKAGLDIEVVVDHRRDAEGVRGDLIDVFRKGEKLWGLHEMKGADSIQLAERCKNVSVLIERDFKDSQGNIYDEAILHSSLCQQPVVPGQKEFIPIAASRASQSDKPVEVARLFLSTNFMENAMNEQQLRAFEKAMGLDEGTLTTDNAIVKIQEHTVATGSELEDLRAELEKLKEDVDDDEKKVDDNPKPEDKTVKLDPDVLDQQRENADEQIDGLVAQNKVTPAVAASLKKVLVGDVAKPNAFCLSRRVSGTDQSIVKGVVEALKQNDPVKLGEATRPQAMELSMQNEDQKDAEVQSEMVDMAGGPTTKDA